MVGAVSKYKKEGKNNMTGKQQRDALQPQICKIANDVRGALDGWDFKQYVLGTLFYRFISENFTSYSKIDSIIKEIERASA
jgi:type I restriction enzyme M protein